MHHDPGKNVLFIAEPLAVIAARLGITVEEASRRLALAQDRLRAARARRTAPVVDRTRYTCWNGMLAAAMIRAGVVLDDPWALDHGLRTLSRIRSEHEDPSALRHSPGGVTGLLDDQVQVALAALDAHEATGEPVWRDWSIAIMGRVWQDYRDVEAGGLYDTARPTGEGLLPTRLKPVQDAPTPSPNGVAALCLARLGELTGEPRWIARRDEIVRTFASAAPRLSVFGATFLAAVDWAVHPATHLVIVEGGEPAVASDLHRLALKTFLPRRVVWRVREAETDQRFLPPAVTAMLGAGRGTRAYACVGTACQAPAASPEAWREALLRMSGPLSI
jgi:uncharacterized protein YyaL (SSP411 family)